MTRVRAVKKYVHQIPVLPNSIKPRGNICTTQIGFFPLKIYFCYFQFVNVTLEVASVEQWIDKTTLWYHFLCAIQEIGKKNLYFIYQNHSYHHGIRKYNDGFYVVTHKVTMFQCSKFGIFSNVYLLALSKPER